MNEGRLSKTIDEAFDNEPKREYRSSRIGASIIGNPCLAYLALVLRGFPEESIPAKLKRIFRDGHRIEDLVIADLRKAGSVIHDKDPMTGEQYKWDRFNGNVVYYADGIIEVSDTESMLLEVKSMNGTLWNKFKERGVKVSHRKYWDQLQMGMGLSGYRKSVLVAYNKDTSEYWDEEIEYDEIAYHYLLHRAQQALTGGEERIAKDNSDWRCKACPKKDFCWSGKEDGLVKDKRTCKHSYLSQNGFACSKGCTDVCQEWERYVPPARRD